MPDPTKPIIIVGEARGEQEARIDSSFVGPSGAELLRMLSESGIISLTSFDRDYINRYYRDNDPKSLDMVWNLHPEVYRTNVFQFHPPANDLANLCGGKAEGVAGYPALLKSKYLLPQYLPELERLANEIMERNPNLILCLGNTALWALAGRSGIAKYRGTTLESTHTVLDYKLLPTYHPAAILRQWELRATTIADLQKARSEAEFPDVRRPKREIWIEPTIDDIKEFIARHILGCKLLSVDIETSHTRITCIGFAPNSETALVVPFDDSRSKNGCYWPTREIESTVWKIISGIMSDRTIPKLFHNGLYDIAFLYRAYGIRTMNAAEDSMLLSHALHPESLKGLGYLGSLYSDQGMWKHMRVKSETIKRGA